MYFTYKFRYLPFLKKPSPALLGPHAYKVTCVFNFPQSSALICTVYTNELIPCVEFS